MTGDSWPQPTISVAPMEGLTTFPMRLWLHLCSQPASMTTPFLRVTRTLPGRELPPDFAPELMELRGALPYELIPQFITADPEQFLRAADLLPPALSPYIELNCGCPSPNALGKLAGSGMLSDPEVFARTIEGLQRDLGASRLAIKMRLGIEDPAEFPALLHAIASLALARLSVHARTRADGYRGRARWEAIKLAAETAKTRVLASGDVLGRETLQKLYEVAPGIGGAMIGRGVLRNPWVFSELRAGTSVKMHLHPLVNALFCYALLQELWQTHPQKLIGRVAKGRIGFACGCDFAAWEKLTVELTQLVYGVPYLLINASSAQALQLSPVAFARLRLLWAYLRSSLPPAFDDPRLLRSKRPADFFELLFKIGEDWQKADALIELRHHTEWDEHFARARG